MKTSVATLALSLAVSPVAAEIPRATMFQFCEHKNTMIMAESAMKAIRLLGETDGAAYHRAAVKKVYERTSDAEWIWLEAAHERILKALLDYRRQEGKYMIDLDKERVMLACKSAIPSR